MNFKHLDKKTLYLHCEKLTGDGKIVDIHLFGEMEADNYAVCIPLPGNEHLVISNHVIYQFLENIEKREFVFGGNRQTPDFVVSYKDNAKSAVHSK